MFVDERSALFSTEIIDGLTFRDAIFAAVLPEGFARIAVAESLANIGGAEKRFAVFNDDADGVCVDFCV